MPRGPCVCSAGARYGGMRPLSTDRACLASCAALLACVACVACAPQEAAQRIGDAAFLDAGAVEVGGTDATGALALVCALDNHCGEAVPCCPEEAPRCVPSATGTNRCVAPGALPLGAPCGEVGVDDCGLGSVCVATPDQAATCRAVCDGADSCGGSECLILTVPGSQSLGVCSNDPE